MVASSNVGVGTPVVEKGKTISDEGTKKVEEVTVLGKVTKVSDEPARTINERKHTRQNRCCYVCVARKYNKK